MPARRRSSLAVIAAVWLAGCAAEGPFPSLAPRAVEQEPATDTPAPPAPVIPSDPATAARIAELARAAREGHGKFQAALAAARPVAARAGAPGSEGWVEAQLAVSRAQAARTPTANALAELDALAVRLAAARPPASQADIAAAVAALDSVQALADVQDEALTALTSSLTGG